jgi:hypothetical protein
MLAWVAIFDCDTTRRPSHRLAMPCRVRLHLALDLLQQLAQLTLVSLCSRPADAQSLLFVWLRDQVEVYVVHNLVRNVSVVLQNVVVLDVLRNSYLLRDGKHFGELVVGYVVELCTVVFGDDELDEVR